MELARYVFEGLCTKAMLISQKEAFKGLEQSQHLFNKPPKVPAPGKKSGGGPNIAFGFVFLPFSFYLKNLAPPPFSFDLNLAPHLVMCNVLKRATCLPACSLE